MSDSYGPQADASASAATLCRMLTTLTMMSDGQVPPIILQNQAMLVRDVATRLVTQLEGCTEPVSFDPSTPDSLMASLQRSLGTGFAGMPDTVEEWLELTDDDPDDDER